ncbi:MAG: aspartyl protease family protein [bacterium]
MGKTIEKVQIQNYIDIYHASIGEIPESEIRTVEVDAIVDTGATYLCIPPHIIKQLGLALSHTTTVTTANGKVDRRIFKGAEISIRDRSVQMQLMENDEKTPALIGYLVLEALDFVVNPKTQGLMGNPEHDGKWVVDLY